MRLSCRFLMVLCAVVLHNILHPSPSLLAWQSVSILPSKLDTLRDSTLLELHPVAGVDASSKKNTSPNTSNNEQLKECSEEDCSSHHIPLQTMPLGEVPDSTKNKSTTDSTQSTSDSTALPQRPLRFTLDGSPVHNYTQLDPLKTALVGGGFTAILGGLQIYQYNAFWSDRTTFRIIEDGDLEYGADKGGHMFAAYTMSKFATDALLTSGFSHDLAVVSGGLIGAGYQFFVEVQDGFGRNWGFSPSDVYANTAGSVLHILQHFVPFFSNIHYKATYFPAPWMSEKTRKGSSNPIDDYSAWTWWFSFNIHGMLWEEAKPFWPSWLNISVGYAARNLEWADASRRYIIALDYDMEKLLPSGGPVWNWFRQYLNLLKLPSPALEFSFAPDGKPLGPPRLHFIFPFKIASIQF